MGEKLVIGPINRGFRNDVTPFNVDNDSFPTLINAYQWRGRVKRKRGTQFLQRLSRYFDSTGTVSYNPSPGVTTIALAAVTGAGNLITGYRTLETNATIVPGSVTITVGVNVYTDTTQDGYLTPTGTGGPNTINYSTGAFAIPAEAGNNASATFRYYPVLPVLGLEDLILNVNDFPRNLAFDKTNSYDLSTSTPYNVHNVSFYKNLATGTYSNYVQKTNWTPLTWNGQNYQQFYSINYQGAFWTTNGISVPYSDSNIGMPGVLISSTGAPAAGPPPSITITTASNHGLVIGDFVFINEIDAAVVTGINFQTGYVTAVPAVNQITVTLPNATLGGAGGATTGLVQFLTARSSTTKDCLRWYDGDPTDGSITSPAFSTGKGWVNFCPPLSIDTYSISDLPPDKYYLVHARIILNYKDRLLFFGPVVQTKNGSPFYLQDTIIYSQVGTPYYTCSFSDSTSNYPLTSSDYDPILLPTNQTATPYSFFCDTQGFGGFIQAGLDEPINTVSVNEDVLILGFRTQQARLVYTGLDTLPFNIFVINSEYGSSSTFSTINTDKAVLTRGSRGYIATSQTQCERFDIPIPDQVFEIRLTDNGEERFTAARDFISEWIYFTYPSNQETHVYPNQTLFYNYRDNSWAIFNEHYTTYGTFRKRTGLTWATVGSVYPTWSQWNVPWSAGSSTLLNPLVIGGTSQGFIMVKNQGTSEDKSLFIKSISGNVITSPDHCLNEGDYIIITDCLGAVSSQVNGKIFSVDEVSTDTFQLNPPITSATYLGKGVITRLYVPQIQTRQFPVAWEMARKTRIGSQQYLLTGTQNGQITLQLFLSQNNDSPYNFGSIVPDISSVNNSLIYSSLLYTCPESTNLGLTAFNSNLNSPTAQQQSQIWHRMNTSLIGDTVQIGFTLSDAQMRSLTPSLSSLTITGATQANPCVLTVTNNLNIGQLVLIENVGGMTQLNGNTYIITARSDTTLTIDVDASAFSAYTSGGTATLVSPIYQTDEIEIHSMILDLQPSQLLV